MLEPVEDLVDRRQRLQLDIGLDLALGGEGERLGHVPARADKRAADGEAVCHHIEQRDRELARRQPDQNACAALAGHANALPERAERGRGDQHAMSAAAGRLFHRGRRVASLGIDHEIRAEALGVRELAVVDVDRTDLEAHDFGILNGQMPQPASAGDDDPFAGLASVSLIPL